MEKFKNKIKLLIYFVIVVTARYMFEVLSGFYVRCKEIQ